ncbi:hypothetical protein M9458_014310, partial [Cirrhinus mrigala]
RRAVLIFEKMSDITKPFTDDTLEEFGCHESSTGAGVSIKYSPEVHGNACGVLKG